MLGKILELLNEWTPNPGNSKEVVERIQSEAGIVFPTDYIELMAWSNGGEGWVGESFLRLWPMEEIPVRKETLHTAEYAPGVVFFGGDGGGMKYGFDTHFDPPAIVEVDAVSIGNPEDTLVRRVSFTEFLKLLHDRQYEDVYGNTNAEPKT